MGQPNRRALPALLLLGLLSWQVCFLGSLGSMFRSRGISVSAQAKQPPPPPPGMKTTPKPAAVSAKPASAPSPQAASDAKESAAEDELTAVKMARATMSTELVGLAKELGIQTNITRSDLQLYTLIKEKGSPKLKDLGTRMAGAELALMMEESNPQVSLFELTMGAAAKAKALEKAKIEIAELETSLEESQQRGETLLQGLKEIAGLVGVGGFGGIMQFFMSEEDIIKETKQKVGTTKR